jgi:CRP/FNR family transcriptional regulator, cyclic AMP receptor protein
LQLVEHAGDGLGGQVELPWPWQHRVAATVRRLTDAATALAFLDLPRRIAKVLLGLPRDADGTISPQLTQEQFAHLAAGTRQSVNAVLRGFEKRGWIIVSGRDLRVLQPEMLAHFVGE